eukprot:3422843-Rhodomonas_salina.3
MGEEQKKICRKRPSEEFMAEQAQKKKRRRNTMTRGGNKSVPQRNRQVRGRQTLLRTPLTCVGCFTNLGGPFRPPRPRPHCPRSLPGAPPSDVSHPRAEQHVGASGLHVGASGLHIGASALH